MLKYFSVWFLWIIVIHASVAHKEQTLFFHRAGGLTLF